MRIFLLVVGFCIVIFAGAWIIAAIMESPQQTPLIQSRSDIRRPPIILPPETVVITDYQSQIQNLQEEIARLQIQRETSTQQQYQNELLMRYYFTDDYFDHDRDNDEFDLTVVVEDEDGDPIEDATVELSNGVEKERDTDEDGEVRFRNLDDDCYDIEVRKSGFTSRERSICLDDDEEITVRLT